MRSYKIIIPYRDRPQHIQAWSNFPKQNNILFVEQSDDGKPFNRGKLLNVGALETTSEYLIFCDVDMIPQGLPKNFRKGVTQLATSEIQTRDYLGGCTMFDRDTFIRAGGYRNDYFHRAEDNEMMFNLKRLKIPVFNEPIPFITQDHARPSTEFDARLWERAKLPRKGTSVMPLLYCEYKVLNNNGNWLSVKIS
jgi:predicted glycosyltransferase involved in capsule biosynthesis